MILCFAVEFLALKAKSSVVAGGALDVAALHAALDKKDESVAPATLSDAAAAASHTRCISVTKCSGSLKPLRPIWPEWRQISRIWGSSCRCDRVSGSNGHQNARFLHSKIPISLSLDFALFGFRFISPIAVVEHGAFAAASAVRGRHAGVQCGEPAGESPPRVRAARIIPPRTAFLILPQWDAAIRFILREKLSRESQAAAAKYSEMVDGLAPILVGKQSAVRGQ